MIDWVNNAPGPFLVIVRGPQASGKTTFAHRFLKGFKVIEADDYFKTGPNGEYVFDGNKIPKAHMDCFDRVKKSLMERYDEKGNPIEKPNNKVAVCNTFIKNEHVMPYVLFCSMNGIPFHIFRIEESRFIDKQQHNVPEQKIKDNIRDFQTQRLPGGISETVVLPPVIDATVPPETTAAPATPPPENKEGE